MLEFLPCLLTRKLQQKKLNPDNDVIVNPLVRRLTSPPPTMSLPRAYKILIKS